MKKHFLFSAVLILLLNFTSKLKAQNNLTPGDLAITSYQSDLDPANHNFVGSGIVEFEDRFSIAVLRQGGLAAGTAIYFTDRGWNGPGNNWLDEAYPPNTFGLGNEAVIKWVVPAGGVAQGVEVFFISKFHDLTPTLNTFTWNAYSNEAGTTLLGVVSTETTLPVDGMGFSVSGDNLLVYQTGPVGGPTGGYDGTPIRFITALLANSNATTSFAGWDAAPSVLNESSLPPGLVNGQTAFLMNLGPLPAEIDNAKFNNCALSAARTCSALQMSALIYSTANWTYNSNAFSIGQSSSICIYPVSSDINGSVYVDADGGTINGTLLPGTVTNTYISLFKSGNTGVPDQVAHVVSGVYSFSSVPDDNYTLVIGTSAAGSYNSSFPNVGGSSMQASAEGESGTAGDNSANGKAQLSISLCGVTYGNAKINLVGSIDFGIKTLSALPVRLVDFAGKSTIKGNELTWKISSEQNFSHYEVEKSKDAKMFAHIAKVMGIGNTKENLSYTYLDKLGTQSTTAFSSQESYYRLKMVDTDGSYEYSNIIFVKNEFDRSIVGEFFPNPTSGKEVTIIINSTEFRDWTISSFDLSGKLLFKENKKLDIGANNIAIKLDDTRFGVSIFRFENAEGVQYRKLIR